MLVDSLTHPKIQTTDYLELERLVSSLSKHVLRNAVIDVTGTVTRDSLNGALTRFCDSPKPDASMYSSPSQEKQPAVSLSDFCFLEHRLHNLRRVVVKTAIRRASQI